jgi:hypothetical protein
MTARGQSIGISIGMLPKTLIVSRLYQLSRLGAEFCFFITQFFFSFWGDMEAITVQKASKYYTTEFDLEKDFKRSMYQHFQFTGEYSLTNS